MGIKAEHVTQGAKRWLRSGGITQGKNEGSNESQKKKSFGVFSKVEVEFS